MAIAIIALLFAQLSVAAYACPFPVTQVPEAMTGTDCEGMASRLDPASPNLCAEHCKYGEQTDHVRVPAEPAASLLALYIVPHIWVLTEPSQLLVASSGLFTARPPPHTILHCCFRI